MEDVLIVGDRVVRPTGPTRAIGLDAGGDVRFGKVGAVSPGVPLRRATIYLGLSRGAASHARRDACLRAPATIRADRAVDRFLSIRETQFSRHPEFVGATVTPAKGTWKGGSEVTRVFQVIWRKNRFEPTFRHFRKNMLDLAEMLSRRLCQDEVLVVVEDGARAWEHKVTPWSEKRGGRRS